MNETGSGGVGFVFDRRALLIALSVIALLGLAAWLF
jgi:hypothetical protein